MMPPAASSKVISAEITDKISLKMQQVNCYIYTLHYRQNYEFLISFTIISIRNHLASIFISRTVVQGAKILNFTLHHIISAFTFQLTDMPDSTENLKLDIKAEYEGVHEILLC